MKIKKVKYSLPAVFIFFASLHAFCQTQTRDFVLSPPVGNLFSSQFNSISFIDARYDTLDLGYVLNKNAKANLIAKIPLRHQLVSVFNYMIDTANAERGEIIFQLLKFKFIVKAELESENGFCFIRANIFSKKNNQYKKLADLDTLIAFNEADVTKALLQAGNSALTEFLGKNLNPTVDLGLEYSYEDILNYENSEKRQLKAYTANAFTDGVYLNYHSFKNQIPDCKIVKAEYKLNGKVKIKCTDKSDAKLTLTGKDIYAFVDNGVAYVCAEYGCNIIERKNNNLFYVGRSKLNESNADYAIPETLAETLGKGSAGMVASYAPVKDKNLGYFLVMIDYVDGSFMKIKSLR